MGAAEWSGASSTGYGGQYGGESRDYDADRDRDAGASEPDTGLWPRLKRGLHVGKGPKGYRRSDERIFEDVCDLLERDPEIDASDITVQVSGGEVTLQGSLNERWTKRRAEDLIDGVAGVKDVHNRLRVAERGGAAAGPGAITSEMPARPPST